MVNLSLPFEDGKDRYEYKFVVEGRDWQINPDKPKVSNHGNVNNYVEIPKKKS